MVKASSPTSNETGHKGNNGRGAGTWESVALREHPKTGWNFIKERVNVNQVIVSINKLLKKWKQSFAVRGHISTIIQFL